MKLALKNATFLLPATGIISSKLKNLPFRSQAWTLCYKPATSITSLQLAFMTANRLTSL
jgi:hypothetical protein